MMTNRLIATLIALLFVAGCEKSGSGDNNPSGATQVNPNWHDATGPAASTANPANVPTGPTGPSQAPTAGSPGAKIFETARSMLGESSSSGPSGGRLACAWMVNKVLQRAIGRTYDHNGTASMMPELERDVRTGRVQKIPLNQMQPGDIIISPTNPDRSKIGHVGIYAGNGAIYSNGSNSAKFEENYTVGTWTARHGANTFAYRVVE